MSPSTASIVCLPATLSGGAQWHALRRAWTGPHEWVTPDLLAEGADLPPAADEGLFTNLLAREVERISEVVRGRPPVHLVGHSYGGVIARRFAREHPAQVRTLTLVEPVCFERLRHFGPASLVDEIRGLGEACRADRRDRPQDAAARFVSYWGGPAAWKALSGPAQRRAARGMPKAVAGWEEIWNGPSSHRDEFCGPSLLVSGTHSPGPSRWIARHCAAEIFPGSRYEEIAGAGHFSPLTHAPALAAALGRLIRDSEGEAPTPEPAAPAMW